MTKDYYLGFDLGTDSVGWAVTDMKYEIQKYRGDLMWGVMLFDEAQHADKRRAFRTARRRFDRRTQRIQLLQELLAPEILKKDKHFFDRLRESKLFPEDAEHRTHNIYFDDEYYNDNDYFAEYPTIHHLICELMENKQEHDIRLIYLACAYLLKHRGHFLIDVDRDNIEKVTDFCPLYNNFIGWFDTYAGVEPPFECESQKFGDILKKKISMTAKEKEFKNLLFDGKAPKQDNYEEYPINVSKLMKLICGGKVQLSEIFKNDEYKELENDSVCAASADFDDILEGMYSQLEEGDGELLKAVKSMYDWSLLEDILKGSPWISKTKAAVYEEHKKDLQELKYLVSNYLSKKEYAEIFKEAGDKDNYVCYVQNLKSLKKGVYPKKKCSQENFCKFVNKYLEKITPNQQDKAIYDRIRSKTEDKSLCPKQVTGDNRVIPYQLFYAELKVILDNASEYLDILNKTDEYGSVKEKILSIMQFRIPYYVGPLVKFDSKKCHAWIEKKAEGKIYPWNFEEKVDLDKTEEAFIRRMTCKCSYIAGEDVLPKNSLLYTKYTVLNEINTISVDGKRISTEAKQKIFEHFFVENKAKVSKKKIKDHLVHENYITPEQEVSGIDNVIRSSLKPYHDFKKLLSSGALTENEVEKIIERITATTDRKRLKAWLKVNYSNLSDEDIAYISKLNYTDYGRLSRMLLDGIYSVDSKTGEINESTIISMMWNTQQNLMELLSSKYGYSTVIEKMNRDYYNEDPETVAEKLENWYVPTAARRTIVRTLDIAKEIKHIMNSEPKKIFIEMARGGGIKNQTTRSRKTAIKEYLESAREFADNEEIDRLESRLEDFNDSSLRSDKYYLYFTQLGRCMYSGEAINLEQIGNNSHYNIDHIIPQAKKTDDSMSNKVLVKSELNETKQDIYPISEEIRHKMYGFWKNLKEKDLITEEKFKRLTRATPLTNEELSEFINRQLVETSQSSKAAAKMLEELFPNSETVYVKAGLVSEFRHKYNMLKCREINDLHHAKDAYLNIVMGNVHDVLFTKDPVNLLKNGDGYSMKMKTYLSWNIKRGDCCAWEKDKSINVVKSMMKKNSIRFVRYSYQPNGQFYEQTIYKASEGLFETKKGLNTEKYGGYNSSSIHFFVPVKYGGTSVCIMPVELIYADRFVKDKEFAKKYSASTLSKILSKEIAEESIDFPLGKRIIKKDALFEINGSRYNVSCKSTGGRTLGITLAESLVISEEDQNYIKNILGYIRKSEHGKKFKVSVYDKITKEENLRIFDMLCQKYINKPFNFLTLEKVGKKIAPKRSRFEALNIEEQVSVLEQMVMLLKTGRSGGCDLQLLGESKQAGVITMNSTLSKIKGLKTVYIIDQSPTGLFEKRSANLLEL